MVRRFAILLVVLVFALEFFAWWRARAPDSGAAKPQIPGLPDSIVTAPAGDPGLTWTPPASWTRAAERPMRFATYRVGRAAGDSDVECAVFYFGAGQGGSVDDNVDRWAAQFVGAPNPSRQKLTVNGLEVTRVVIDGTFLSPGTDMRSQGQQPDWRLLGAIARGPRGEVFFKLTGPVARVTAAESEFDAMLATLAPH